MGKNIFTAKQLNFLELVQQDKQITKRFYLTGGTALAEFYLHHRLSEDIDLFTETEEVDQQAVLSFLKKISPKLSIIKIGRTNFLGLFSFLLHFKDGKKLKVDFNFYPFPRIDKGLKFKNLEVDSLYDIAANKVHTLFMKARSRDYVDLYFILKEYDYPLEKLILDAKAKFDWDIERSGLVSQLMRVVDIDTKDLPTMLVPFDRKKMEEFFLAEAKKLKKEILK
ncbi:hypothetical protein A2617_04720 [Candidatus Daviesbacteria bacterium RIFOXYD1_FULL_41_10]|uniref:Nucleotidyl transferase AbiEii/AbiGii toxin family protein n=3 Tax=Patescibacteria group TaxID=1783273 RepID=A0A1F5N255_9BACT|nr:MAG: hypothetical protein UU67_C0058G0006 [Candidatus Daviesbacteria bacterium GW2011_GWB1_41_5]KKT81594.1 MAG: hypothetical protein UW78_C0007G0016 [Candidatus Azambacteria bacterium GW2011_GWA1_44_9]OGE71560.1 MAG: hypothetical protein A2617_04720 [Candidatus Daviesbacteria bacterium RIFOXYD1_FULL_41_10]